LAKNGGEKQLPNIVGNKVKVILTIDEMGEPVSASDISWKSGVEKTEVQEILRQLEQDDVVTKVPPLSESLSDVRFYKLTSRAKKLLQQLVATQLEELIGRPQVVQVRA
jgi:DNA-binding MarR family transcriptional regulator